jgi:hypothetical protein
MKKIFCDHCGKEINPIEEYQFLVGIIVEKKVSMMETKNILGLEKLPQNPPATFLEEFIGKEIYLCRDCLKKFKDEFLKEKPP